jgi:Ser/Thr protein kinase RdoA (MazF antagonist)
MFRSGAISNQRVSGKCETQGGADLLGYRFAEAALELYGLSGADLTPLKEGKNSSLFRVSSRSRGNFLLRSYAPLRAPVSVKGNRRGAAIRSLFSEAALHSQALWLSDLRKTERLPVPEPMPTADGTFMGTVSLGGPADRRLFLLLRWIPGQQKKGIEFTIQDAHDLGSYIARLHLHAEQFSPPEGFFRPRWDWETLFDESATYWRLAKVVLSREELAALRFSAERIKETLNAIGETSDQFGIIHRDLHPAMNIIFHEGVLYAIDFDHCGWGHYMYDLAKPYMYFEGLGERYKQMREVLLEGYESRRSLPNDHHVVMETFVNMHRMNSFIRAVSGLQEPRLAEISASPARKSTLLRDTIGHLVQVPSNGIE